MTTLTEIKINSDIETKDADPELGWKTVLHNDDFHSFESVTEQLIKALGCSYEEANRYTHIAHTYGKATVFKGAQKQCDGVADILAEIGLRVKVEQ